MVGGWVGGWVGRRAVRTVTEKELGLLSFMVGGWVDENGGWVGGWVGRCVP